MAILDDDTLLARWLSGDLTEAERTALEQHPDFHVFRKIAETAARFTPPDAETPQNWPAVKSAIESNTTLTVAIKPSPRKWIWYSAAAAVAAIIVSVWLLMPPADLVVTTGIAEQKTVTLPDNSVVKLNAGSQLTIKRARWSESRHVTLQGEAYFDVVSNPESVFYVHTTTGKVTVLGTTFTVLDREEGYGVACYTGSVMAESNEQAFELPPGRRLYTNRDGIWHNEEVNEGDQPSWVKGPQTVLTEASISMVTKELERRYPITIQVKPAVTKLFSGQFPNDNLQLALDVVSKTLDLKYTVEGSVVIFEAN